jgi:hypothetical protein
MNLPSLKSANLWNLVAAAILAPALALPALAQDSSHERDTLLTGEQWQAFNRNLIEAVQSESEGVREGALVQIAHYGDYMDFPELTVFEVMHIYRDDRDPGIKRLAVVALGNMGSRWAIEFLAMLAPYEKDPALRRTMKSVVREARQKA